MEKEYVRCQIEEGIAVVTIDNPTALNALNAPTLTQLDQIFDKLGGNPEVKGVIITGGGEKSFVAGADISEFLQVKGNTAAAFMARGQRIFDKIEAFDRPVIAAINGFALGGGNELAMCLRHPHCCRERHLRTARSQFGGYSGIWGNAAASASDRSGKGQGDYLCR